jgi:hypothetical protein
MRVKVQAKRLKENRNILLKLGDAYDAFRGVSKTFSPSQANVPQFYSFGNLSDTNTVYFTLDNNDKIYQALTECPQVSTVLLRKAQAYANGRISVVNSQDNPIPKTDRISKIIKTPNIIQSDNQFRTQLYFYMLAYGYCPVMKVRAVGFETSSLWILPPNLIQIEWIKTIPFFKTDINDLIVSVTYKNGNDKIKLNKEDLYFFTDTTGLNEQGFLPCSRLSALKYPINNLIKNYKSRGRMIEKPYGILSNQARDNAYAPTLDETERERLYQEFNQYGVSDGKKDVIITDTALNWQMMMYPVEQMQFLDMQDSDTQVICDKLGYPHDLLGNRKGTTFNNKEQSIVSLYTEHTIPDSINIDQQYSECLELGETRSIKTTFDHITALQADQKTSEEAKKIRSEWVWAAYNQGGISLNRALFLLDEPDMGVEGNKYFEPKIIDNGSSNAGN